MIIISGADADANNEFCHMLCRQMAYTVSPLHARELHGHLPIVCLTAVHRRVTYIARLYTLSVGGSVPFSNGKMSRLQSQVRLEFILLHGCSLSDDI